MGEAYLGGIKGLGTMHVVRDQIGGVYEVAGTWRLPDDASEQDLGALQKARESGRAINYKGKLSDAKKPDKGHIELEVTISSIQSYTFDATDDSLATKCTLYNYDLAGKPIKLISSKPRVPWGVNAQY